MDTEADTSVNISDQSESSDHSSDEEIDLDFDPIIREIESIQQTITVSLAILDRLQHSIQDEIKHGDRSLDQILDELHSDALKEIEVSGQSSFGSKIVALFS